MRRFWAQRRRSDVRSVEHLIQLDGRFETVTPTRRVRRGLNDAATAVADALKETDWGSVLLVPALANLVEAPSADRTPVSIYHLREDDLVLAPVGALGVGGGTGRQRIDWEAAQYLEGYRLASATGEGRGVNLAFRAVATLVWNGLPTLVRHSQRSTDVHLTIEYETQPYYGIHVSGIGELEAEISGARLEFRPEGWLQVTTSWPGIPGAPGRASIKWIVPTPVQDGGIGERARASLQTQWLKRRGQSGDPPAVPA